MAAAAEQEPLPAGSAIIRLAREATPTSRCGGIDMGVGYRGAGEGPTALRAMRRSVGSMETMVQWRSELTAVDFGNAPIDNLSRERSMPPIRRIAREIAETGAIRVIIGGDHSIEFANVAGLADVYGKENVGPRQESTAGSTLGAGPGPT